MLLPFVALIQMPQQGFRFLPIAAANAEQAVVVAGQLCVRDGAPDALIVAMFSEQDVANAQGLIAQASAAISGSQG